MKLPLAAAVLCIGAFCSTLPASAQEPAPKTSIFRADRFPLDELQAKTVHVSFKSSAKLTQAFSERLAASGVTVVSSQSPSDFEIQIDGGFFANREFGRRRVTADIGTLFEKSGSGMASAQRGGELWLTPSGTLTTTVVASGLTNLLEVASRATGVHDWFNNLVAGDPDGFCFKGCEYDQSAEIQVSISTPSGKSSNMLYISVLNHKSLYPTELIQTALDSALSALGKQSPETR